MTDLDATYSDLSHGQQGLWLRQATNRRERGFNILRVVDLPAGVEPDQVEHALAVALDRHDVFRSTFGFEGGSLRRQIGTAKPDLMVVDVGDYPNGLADVLERCRRDELDLSGGPLLLCTMVNRAGGGVSVVLVTNHLCADGRSLEMLADQIERSVVGPPDLDDLGSPPTYADFVAWEQAWLSSPRGRASRDYWRNKVVGLGAGTQVAPTVRRTRRNEPGSGTVALPSLDALTPAIADLVSAPGISAAGVFAALWVDVLSTVSRSWPVALAVPVDARPVKFRSVVGTFANYVVLTAPADRPVDFHQLAGAMSTELLTSLRHRQVPIEIMVSDADPDRSAVLRPFTQVAFEYDGAGEAGPRPDMPTEVRAFHPVELAVEHLGDHRHRASLRYDTEQHDPAAMSALGDHFVRRANALLQPARSPRVSEPVEPSVEPVASPAGVVSPFRLVAAAAAHDRDRPAVADDVADLTYGELMDRIDALRSALAAELGRDERSAIAVCLDRSVDMIIAILAIESLGVRFVPIDADWPIERMRYVVDDSGASRVLVDGRTVGIAGATADRWPVPTLSIDRLVATSGLGFEPVHEPPEVMYTMYTSGSTGSPKGVDVGPTSVGAFLDGFSSTVGIDADTSLLALSSLTFDISLAELLAPLAAGGRVVVAGGDDLRHLDRLGRLALDHQVTTIQATPSLWGHLVDQPWIAELAPTVLCGGERLDPALGERLVRVGSAAWNLYGPTEATIWVLAHRLAPGCSEDSSIPIGRPLPGVGVHVLAGDEPVGPWIPGELAVSGPYLATGYRNLADVTAEKFAPLGTVRAYRTGDIALARDDGVIEFLGREDDQVKVRGYRIEHAEVEHWLLSHPEISAAASYLTSGDGAEPQLRAAVVLEAGADLDAASIGAFLRAHLPRYMIPSAYRFLTALPLTTSGKVDRVALRSGSGSAVSVASRREPPRTHSERVVYAIVAELLGSEEFGMTDNFFDVGGDSLLAIEFVALIEERFGRFVDFDRLFDGASFRELAEEVAS